MSHKTRLRQLENKNSTRSIAFFSITHELMNREDLKSKLWKEFLYNGGDRNAIPAFLPEIVGREGFLGYCEMTRLKELIMNRSKNPAEIGSHH
jgi:hypothetical protein